MEKKDNSVIAGIKMIDTYLSKKGLKIIDYDNRNFDIENLCGERISDTCNIEYLQSLYDDDEYIILLCINSKDEVLALFVGTIELDENFLESTYTCARKVQGIGEIMRYYGYLNVYDKYPNIKILKGSASGGIPALHDKMTKSEEEESKDRLKKYHIKRGASLIDSIFIYTWDTILKNVVKIIDRGSKKKYNKKHTKKKRKLSSRAPKSTRASSRIR